MEPLSETGPGLRPRAEAAPLCAGIVGRSTPSFLAVLAVMIAAFLGWAHWTVLDMVKRGSGRVVPQIQNQIVQHLEGGIVSEILVREGERVEKGAPLLRVRNSFSAAELAQTRLDIRARTVRLARLAAEIAGEPRFSVEPHLAKGIEAIVASEQAVFSGRRTVLDEQLAIFDEEATQKRLELSTLRARRTSTRSEREIVAKQVGSLRHLASIGALSNNDLLDSERALQQIEARISDLSHDIPRTQSEIAEIERRRSEARLRLRAEAEAQAAATELEIAKLREAAAALSDRSIRSEVLAPVGGTVNKLFVTTVGGVVKSGDPLVQIVPGDAAIAVEARLSPSDRAEVWPGLPAVIKISAYDYSLHGGLKGTVTEISSDALQDERGQPYFRVRLEASSADLGPDRPVVPGMTAEVDILAGRQRVIDALLRPARLLRDNALRL